MAGNQIKTWGEPSTLSFHDCPVCVVQGVEVIKIPKKDKDKYWLPTRKYNYRDPASFAFDPVLFQKIKHLGSVVIIYIFFNLIGEITKKKIM